MRVTSDPAFAITTGVAANTVATTAAILATDRDGVAPRGEGHTVTTLLSPPLVAMRCKVGLHSSRMGGGAMLNPINIWPLSNNYRSVMLKKLKL